MMKVQVLTALPLLLAQLSLAPAQAEARGGSLQRQPRGWGPPEAPHPAGSGGDTLLGQAAEDSHPLAGAWEVLAEPPQAPSEARGSGQQGPPSQLRRRPPQPSRSRSLGLSQHLKGHGKFNADTVSASPARGALTGTSLPRAVCFGLKTKAGTASTSLPPLQHSCHGIQRRPCQKPSDCSGCLGLYTCKLPAGTCGLKAVSWQRGRRQHPHCTLHRLCGALRPQPAPLLSGVCLHRWVPAQHPERRVAHGHPAP